MKILFTSVFFLLTTLAYCQQSKLFQNINFRAKELKHHLNAAGDSLTLKGERTIYKVAIFNRDFEHTVLVGDSQVIIPLKDIPLGRFVVEASLTDKLIVLTLLRDQPMNANINVDTSRKKTSLFGPTPLTPRMELTVSKEQTEAPRLVVATTNEDTIGQTANLDISNQAQVSTTQHVGITANVASTNTHETLIEESLTINKTVNADPAHKIVQGYWIEYKTNSSYGGGTVKRIGDEAIVDRMIAIITLDKKTIAGRQNELTIWEVYDVSAFLKYKMKRKNDLSNKAECFNVKPFFKA